MRIRFLQSLLACALGLILLTACGSSPACVTSSPATVTQRSKAPTSTTPSPVKTWLNSGTWGKLVQQAVKYEDAHSTNILATYAADGTLYIFSVFRHGKENDSVTVIGNYVFYSQPEYAKAKTTGWKRPGSADDYDYAADRADSDRRSATAQELFKSIMADNFGRDWETKK